MTRLTRGSLLLGISTLMGWNAIGQNEHRREIILPGKSVGGVELGEDAVHFERAFPKRSASDNHSSTGTFGEGCPTEVYYWSNLAKNTSAITAYLNADQISQISTQGPIFSLVGGLGMDVTEKQVRQAYPKGLAYVLTGSADRLNGGRDAIYWVDGAAGVAFRLTWWPSKRERAVSGIDIFPTGTDFRPEGCISPPQQWRKLKS